MKNKTVIFLACLSLLTSNCYKNKSDILEKNTAIKEAKDEEIMSNDYLVSNMNDDKSIAFVKNQ